VRNYFLAVVFLLTPFGSTFASDAVSPSTAAAPLSVDGKWQLSWQVRLGTTRGTLVLHQTDSKISGTFDDQRGSSQLSGSIEGTTLTFQIQFQGPRPYTIEFSGKVEGDKITGTSVAKNVGDAGAFLGHGGEVVQPQHPWTATRQLDSSSRPDQPGEPGKPKS
jgi:hypothetical protein